MNNKFTFRVTNPVIQEVLLQYWDTVVNYKSLQTNVKSVTRHVNIRI